MEKVIEDGWVCYDIGAHIGYFSLLMARLCVGKVFAFEPEPENSRFLKKHVEINGLSELVRVRATTIDHFVYVRANREPNFVKIDVPGSEVQCLEGGRVLEGARPVVLCEIHNSEQGLGVYRILSEQRYLFFDVEEGLRRLTGPKPGGHILACHSMTNRFADET